MAVDKQAYDSWVRRSLSNMSPEQRALVDAQRTPIGKMFEAESRGLPMPQASPPDLAAFTSIKAHTRSGRDLSGEQGDLGVLREIAVAARAQAMESVKDTVPWRLSDQALVDITLQSGTLNFGEFVNTLVSINNAEHRARLTAEWKFLEPEEQVRKWESLSDLEKNLLRQSGVSTPAETWLGKGWQRTRDFLKATRVGPAAVGTLFAVVDSGQKVTGRMGRGATRDNPWGLFDATTEEGARETHREEVAPQERQRQELQEAMAASDVSPQVQAQVMQGEYTALAGQQVMGWMRELTAAVGASLKFWRWDDYWELGGSAVEADGLFREEAIAANKELYDLDETTRNWVFVLAKNLDSHEVQKAMHADPDDPEALDPREVYMGALEQTIMDLAPGFDRNSQRTRSALYSSMLENTVAMEAAFHLAVAGRISFGRNAAARAGNIPGTQDFAETSGIADGFRNVVLDPLNVIGPARSGLSAIRAGIRSTDNAANSARILKILRGSPTHQQARRVTDQVATAASEDLASLLAGKDPFNDFPLGEMIGDLDTRVGGSTKGNSLGLGDDMFVPTAPTKAKSALEAVTRALRGEGPDTFGAERIVRNVPLWNDPYNGFVRFVQDQVEYSLRGPTGRTLKDVEEGVIYGDRYVEGTQDDVIRIFDGREMHPMVGITRERAPMFVRDSTGQWRLHKDFINNETVNAYMLRMDVFSSFRQGRAAGTLYKVPLLPRDSLFSLPFKRLKQAAAVAIDYTAPSHVRTAKRYLDRGIITEEDFLRIAPAGKGALPTALRLGGKAIDAEGPLRGTAMAGFELFKTVVTSPVRLLESITKGATRGALMVNRANSNTTFRDYLSMLPSEVRAQWFRSYTNAKSPGQRVLLARHVITEVATSLGLDATKAGARFVDEMLKQFDEVHGVRRSEEMFALTDEAGQAIDQIVDPVSGMWMSAAIGAHDLAHGIAMPDMRKLLYFARMGNALDVMSNPLLMYQSGWMNLVMGRIWNPSVLYKPTFPFRVSFDEYATTAVREGLVPLLAARLNLSNATSRHIIPKPFQFLQFATRQVIKRMDVARVAGAIDDINISPSLAKMLDRFDEASRNKALRSKLTADLQESGQFADLSLLVESVKDYIRDASPYELMSKIKAGESARVANAYRRLHETGQRVNKYVRDGLRVLSIPEREAAMVRMLSYSGDTGRPVPGYQELLSSIESAASSNPSVHTTPEFISGRSRVQDPFHPRTLEVEVLDFMIRRLDLGETAHDPHFIETMQQLYERRAYDPLYAMVTDEYLELVPKFSSGDLSNDELLERMVNGVLRRMRKDEDFRRVEKMFMRENVVDGKTVIEDHLYNTYENLRGRTPPTDPQPPLNRPPDGGGPGGPDQPPAPTGQPRVFADENDIEARLVLEDLASAMREDLDTGKTFWEKADLKASGADPNDVVRNNRRKKEHKDRIALLENVITAVDEGLLELDPTVIRALGLHTTDELLDPLTRQQFFDDWFGTTWESLVRAHDEEFAEAVFKRMGILTERGNISPYWFTDNFLQSRGALGFDEVVFDIENMGFFQDEHRANDIISELVGRVVDAHMIANRSRTMFGTSTNPADIARQKAILTSINKLTREMDTLLGAEIQTMNMDELAVVLGDPDFLRRMEARLPEFQSMFSEEEFEVLRQLWEAHRIVDDAPTIGFVSHFVDENYVMGQAPGEFILSPLHVFALSQEQFHAIWHLRPPQPVGSETVNLWYRGRDNWDIAQALEMQFQDEFPLLMAINRTLEEQVSPAFRLTLLNLMDPSFRARVGIADPTTIGKEDIYKAARALQEDHSDPQDMDLWKEIWNELVMDDEWHRKKGWVDTTEEVDEAFISEMKGLLGDEGWEALDRVISRRLLDTEDLLKVDEIEMSSIQYDLFDEFEEIENLDVSPQALAYVMRHIRELVAHRTAQRVMGRSNLSPLPIETAILEWNVEATQFGSSMDQMTKEYFEDKFLRPMRRGEFGDDPLGLSGVLQPPDPFVGHKPSAEDYRFGFAYPVFRIPEGREVSPDEVRAAVRRLDDSVGGVKVEFATPENRPSGGALASWSNRKKRILLDREAIRADYENGLAYLRGGVDSPGSRQKEEVFRQMGVNIDELLEWFEGHGGAGAYTKFIRDHEQAHRLLGHKGHHTDDWDNVEAMVQEFEAFEIAFAMNDMPFGTRTHVGHLLDRKVVKAARTQMPPARKGPPPTPPGGRHTVGGEKDPFGEDISSLYVKRSDANRAHAELLVQSWSQSHTLDPFDAAELIHRDLVGPREGMSFWRIVKDEDDTVTGFEPVTSMREADYLDDFLEATEEDMAPLLEWVANPPQDEFLQPVLPSVNGVRNKLKGTDSKVFRKPIVKEDYSELEAQVEQVLLELMSETILRGGEMSDGDPLSMRSFFEHIAKDRLVSPADADAALGTVTAALQSILPEGSPVLKAWYRMVDGNGRDVENRIMSIGDELIGKIKERADDPKWDEYVTDFDELMELGRIRAIPNRTYSTRYVRVKKDIDRVIGDMVNNAFRPLVEWADWISRQPMVGHYYTEAYLTTVENFRNYYRSLNTLPQTDPRAMNFRSQAALDLGYMDFADLAERHGPGLDWASLKGFREKVNEYIYQPWGRTKPEANVQKMLNMQEKGVPFLSHLRKNRWGRELKAPRWMVEMVNDDPHFGAFIEDFLVWAEKNLVDRDFLDRMDLGDLFLYHLDASRQVQERIHEAAMLSAYDKVSTFADVDTTGSLFALRWRNAFPFFWAEERFIKRLTQTAYHSPESLQRMQLTYRGIDSAGWVQEDSNGNKIFVYPGGNQMNHALARAMGIVVPGVGKEGFLLPVDVEMTGRLLWAAPGIDDEIGPELGPATALPIVVLSRLFPEVELIQTMEETLLTDLSGDPNKKLLDLWMPSAARKALATRDAEETFYAQAFNATAFLVAADLAPEDAPGNALERQAFIERVKNWTRVLAIQSSIMSFTGIAPATMEVEGSEKMDELRDLTVKLGPSDGLVEFMRRNPDATSFTLYATSSVSGGPISADEYAWKHLRDNETFFRTYPAAASYFMPDIPEEYREEKFLSRAFGEQMAMGLRIRTSDSSDDLITKMVKDVYFQETAQEYFEVKNKYEDEIAMARSMGLNSEAVDLESLKQQELTFIKESRPVFNEIFQVRSGKGKTSRILEEVKSALEDPNAPLGDRTETVKVLLEGYENYKTALIPYKNYTGRKDIRPEVASIKADFLEWGFAIANENPEYASAFWHAVILEDMDLGSPTEAINSIGRRTIGQTFTGEPIP